MQSGISRRDLLKRSAVAGGLVWVAPTILASPASATHDPCNCPHGALFGLKHNVGSNTCENTGNNPSTGNCAASAGFTTNGGCCLIPSLITFSRPNNETHRYTLKPGVRFCRGFAKCANDCFSGSPQVTSAPGSGGTTVVTITCPNLSHSELVVCVDGTAIPAGC